jgi:hypothetical protein
LGQAARFDLQQGDVGTVVAADHLGGELALIVELDGDLVGVVDDVRVGEDVAVRADDETGALATARRQVAHLALGRHEAPEELEHFVLRHVGHVGHARVRHGALFLGGGDVHHGGGLLFHQIGEIRQGGGLGRSHQAQRHAEEGEPILHMLYLVLDWDVQWIGERRFSSAPRNWRHPGG